MNLSITDFYSMNVAYRSPLYTTGEVVATGYAFMKSMELTSLYAKMAFRSCKKKEYLNGMGFATLTTLAGLGLASFAFPRILQSDHLVAKVVRFSVHGFSCIATTIKCADRIRTNLLELRSQFYVGEYNNVLMKAALVGLHAIAIYAIFVPSHKGTTPSQAELKNICLASRAFIDMATGLCQVTMRRISENWPFQIRTDIIDTQIGAAMANFTI